jgi:hypothetical protein
MILSHTVPQTQVTSVSNVAQSSSKLYLPSGWKARHRTIPTLIFSLENRYLHIYFRSEGKRIFRAISSDRA